jgi:hypothetical protein
LFIQFFNGENSFGWKIVEVNGKMGVVMSVQRVFESKKKIRILGRR